MPSGPRIHSRLAASLPLLPPSFHLLFLGRCLDRRCGQNRLRVSRAADLYRVPPRSARVGDADWQQASPMCLHSYLVSREGALAVRTGSSSDGSRRSSGSSSSPAAPAGATSSLLSRRVRPPLARRRQGRDGDRGGLAGFIAGESCTTG